jgi:TM2 domain-containing membrane protein YozV
MDCVNHQGVNATAYCQNCGKAMCAACVRVAPGGQVLCEPCLMAWQNLQQPFAAAPMPSGANPAAAAVLGLIPGVGAMYNGQFFKGLIHVVIFAVLISISEHFPLFGIFIGAWVLYQAFEAYHTAVARRDGLPLPDPLGLNEVGNLLNLSSHPRTPYPPSGANPGAVPGQPPAGAAGASGNAGPYAPPTQGGTAPYGAGYRYGEPMPPIPPVPPVPPVSWQRKEPLGAIFLVGFGLILLLDQLGIVSGRFLSFLWPLVFIGFGLWLIIRRVGETKGGAQ